MINIRLDIKKLLSRRIKNLNNFMILAMNWAEELKAQPIMLWNDQPEIVMPPK